MKSKKSIFFFILGFVAAAVGLPGTAAAGGAAAATVVETAPHQRLIIRLREMAAAAGTGYNLRQVQLDLGSIANRATTGPAGLSSLQLSHVKSITPRLHVAATDRKLSRSEMLQLLAQLQQDGRVEYAEIDERIAPSRVPNDPLYASSQWNLRPAAPGSEGSANLPQAWDRADGSGVIVAVVDTGIRPHAEFASRVLPGYDFVSDSAMANDGDGRDADPGDPGDWVDASETQQGLAGCSAAASSWHGTKMAGTIAAAADNGAGIAGIASAVRLLPVRVFGKCGGYISDVIDGVYWASGLAVAGVPANPNPAKVINLSMAAEGSCSRSFQDAIDAARGRGAVVIAATGNKDSIDLSQPANCSGVIAVTAHTKRGDHASYANGGAGTTLSAPGGGNGVKALTGDGEWITAASNGGTSSPGSDSYGTVGGTSVATAHVSGVAALLLGMEPRLTPDQVESLLKSSARSHPTTSYCYGSAHCGSGMLDASAAVKLLQAGVPATSSAVSSAASSSAAADSGGGGSTGWPEALALLSLALLRVAAQRKRST